MRVATDIGGTFTDLVYYDFDEKTGEAGTVRTSKADTTPPHFEKGILDTFRKAGIAPKAFTFFAHGTTVVINALLARQGAKTALLTTKGFRDVLEIARGNRPDLFNFTFEKPKPFVPRYLRREVDERTNYKGEILTPADASKIAPILEDFPPGQKVGIGKVMRLNDAAMSDVAAVFDDMEQEAAARYHYGNAASAACG